MSISTAVPAARTRVRVQAVDILRGLVMIIMALDAPAFMFCAGLAAFLRLERGGSKSELSRFLASRGLWPILLVRCSCSSSGRSGRA